MQGAREAHDARGPRRILIGGDDPEIVELLDNVLGSAGYALQTVVGLANLVDLVRRQQPHLLVLDLDRDDLTGDAHFPTLDALRADPQAAQVPVVTLSTRPAHAEEALTSYTVKATLAAPFELDELFAAVRQALDEPPPVGKVAAAALEEAVPTGVALAARLLAERSRAALFRWVLRLRHEEPWASRADLHLASLLDSAPVIAEAVVVTVRTGDAERVLQAHPEVLTGARTHAQTRQQQGIDLAAALRELAMLRAELWAIFPPVLPSGLTA